ncbi:variable large family protein, partial [Borreliella bissettiae]|uniref:variable large family protein n=1 Tax=Borrelia bissettiae TaxID=64897 RepID=UPI001E3BEF64
AIVEAAEEKDQAGKKANAATNPIEAAIGTADAAVDFGNDMKKRNDKIAAAIVLRGLAKDGKFAAAAGNETIESAVESAVGKVSKWLDEMIKAANEAATKGGTGDGSEKIGDSGAANAGVKADKDSVNGIAKGIKGIVEAAGKADGGTGGALKGVTAAGDNKEAGKLFAVGAGGDAAADADIKKAAAAVSAVSGEQILKAIVEAAEKGEQKGKKADAAKNPIEAAIGTAEAGVDFGNEMKKNDKIQD